MWPSSLLDETLVTLTEITKRLPNRPHVATVYRWAQRGPFVLTRPA